MIGKAQWAFDELVTALAYSIWVYELGERLLPKGEPLSFTYGIELSDLKGNTSEAVKYVCRTQSGCEVIKYVDDIKNGLQVAITLNRGSQLIYVVFRGSDEKYDWLANSKGYKCNINSKVAVHAGFLGLIDSHKNNLFRIIDALLKENPTFNIVMTGHSLGGALCTLFGFLTAERLSSTVTKVKVISFASPRVGNYHFRKAIDRTENLTCIRVTHRRDIITACPLYRYYHAGRTVVHLEKSGFKVYENYGYSLLTFSLFQCWSVADHGTDGYWSALLRSTAFEGAVEGLSAQLMSEGVQLL
jgi:hypothetical protein